LLLSRALCEAFAGGNCGTVASWLDRVSERSSFFGLYAPAVLARCRGDMELFARETARLERMGIPWTF